MLQIFIWIVCLQLIGYGWHRMGINLLIELGAPGRSILKTFDTFRKDPMLLAFPLLTILLLLFVLGVSLGWWLIAAALPVFKIGQAPGDWVTWEAFGIVYLASGMACFLPAAVLAGKMVNGLRASIRRLPSFVILGLWCLVWAWPLEIMLRLAHARSREGRPWLWMARTGTPFAALLTCAVMVKERLGPWEALVKAAGRFPAAAEESGAEFWGRAPFQIPFLLWCLASPVLLSLSLMPALKFGFHPTYIFNLWFLADRQFAIGFGLWAGILLSVNSLGQLMVLGAVRAAQLVKER